MKIRVFKREGVYYAEFSGGIRKSLKSSNKVEALQTLEVLKILIEKKTAAKLAPGKPTKLSVFAGQYETHRVGISKWTIKKDLLTLKLLGEAVGDILLETLDAGEIDKFKLVCVNRGTTPQTINGYLRHLKAALHFALDRELIVKIPTIKMLPERKVDMIHRVIAPDDLDLLLETATSDDSLFGAYLTVLFWTGCRRREILNLEWPNVDFKTHKIYVRGLGIGKGMKERTVPMLPQVEAILEPIKKDDGRVFPQWHPDTVSKWFLALCRHCGIDARLHDLRHSAATYMLKSGIPIEVVKKILGHASLTTTMVYAHVLDDVMAKEMKKMKIK